MNTGKKKAPTHRVFNDVSGLFTWSWWPDLNRRPADYELWLLGVVSLNVVQ